LSPWWSSLSPAPPVVGVVRTTEVRVAPNKIKHCQRIATRYDKLAANYLAIIQLGSIRLWLRAYESASQFFKRTIRYVTLSKSLPANPYDECRTESGADWRQRLA
jgi:hypothetical protein